RVGESARVDLPEAPASAVDDLADRGERRAEGGERHQFTSALRERYWRRPSGPDVRENRTPPMPSRVDGERPGIGSAPSPVFATWSSLAIASAIAGGSSRPFFRPPASAYHCPSTSSRTKSLSVSSAMV